MESAEAVAFALLKAIGKAEGKNLEAYGEVDREWILRTYHQCRKAVSSTNKIDDIVDDYKPST